MHVVMVLSIHLGPACNVTMYGSVGLEFRPATLRALGSLHPSKLLLLSLTMLVAMSVATHWNMCTQHHPTVNLPACATPPPPHPYAMNIRLFHLPCLWP
jgi:hypothetical protein